MLTDGTPTRPTCRATNFTRAMLFIARRTNADLELTKPLDYCCNCGHDGDVDLIATPMQLTRFFLVVGTELNLRDDFPY